MRVLLISNMYPNKENPQFGVFVKNCEGVLLDNGIDVDRIVCTKKKSKLSKMLQYMIFYARVLFRVLTSNYNCIYVHYLSYSSLPIIIAKKIKKNINIVSNVHGSDVIPQNKKHKVLNNLSKKCAEISDIVIVPSNYFKKEIINRWNISEEKIYIYPSGGVNNKIFRPKTNLNECKEKFRLDDKFKYIGFVSRLESGKGWNILLEAINKLKNNANLKDYKFIFVGNGKEQNEFKLKVKDLNLNDLVIHINFLHQEQLADLYNCLELFCFPTEANESLGLVAIEAIACGIPVVASNFAALTEYIIKGYNGYLFEKGNSNELSYRIEEYISLKEEDKLMMKKYAYESSVKYWSKNVENDLINIFNYYKN